MALLRFRSARRDSETDSGRILPILAACQAALASVETELTGVRARVQDARRRAAFLFGNDLPSATGGDTVADEELDEAEQAILTGERRVRQLEAQGAKLGAIVRDLTSILES